MQHDNIAKFLGVIQQDKSTVSLVWELGRTTLRNLFGNPNYKFLLDEDTKICIIYDIVKVNDFTGDLLLHPSVIPKRFLGFKLYSRIVG